MRSRQRFFDDTTACFVGVSLDPMDETEKRVADHYPGYRYVWDFDGTISPLYGALPRETDGERSPLRNLWFVLDPTLRLVSVIPFARDQSEIAACARSMHPGA
jgi:peroxiredoxin